MSDKDLIKQLNQLQNIKADSSWIRSNREVLLHQISSQEVETPFTILELIKSFSRTALRPAMALAVFVFVLISGSVFAHNLFNTTKPNDSLYIARVVSEKARLSTIFNQESHDKMELKFANDRAKDIADVLAHVDQEDTQVARLNKDFRKEIATVKKNIKTTSQEKKPNVVEEDTVVMMADSKKDKEGVLIKGEEQVKGEEKAVQGEEGASEEKKEEDLDANKIMEEVEESFDNKDYQAVIDKLNKVEEIVK